MNKQDLISKIKQLDGVTQDERAYLINLVNTKKKYGLVWEDKREDVEEQLRNNLPVLKEVKDKAIINGEDNPNHILIEGDNLHARTALTFTHEGAIDVIYIDPPYNTGGDSFQYNDSFNHSTWLTFMKNRLEVALELLREDGTIFIQTDDAEQAYLKVLMDGIFGRKNYINTISVQFKDTAGASGGGEDKRLKKNVEYITIFAKNREIHKGFKSIYNNTKKGELVRN